MAKYRFPEPLVCLRCGGKCYARDWFRYTATGNFYPEGLAVVYWQCSQCGRRFRTMELIETAMIERDWIPKPYFEIKYEIIEEEREDQKEEENREDEG